MPLEVPKVLKAKVCLLGEAEVGKTSLVRRFVLDQFDDRYLPTLGVKVTKKEATVRVEGDAVRVVLTILDVFGERSFLRLLRDGYFRGAQGILAVGDGTRPGTIRALPDWVDAARRVSGPLPVVVLGNKVDLPPARGAMAALAEAAGALEATSWLTSAKTGANVEEAFLGLARILAEGGAPEESPRPEPRASR